MNRVKKYNEQGHKIALQEITKHKNSAILLEKLYSEIFGIEDHTVEALENHLRDKSGFSNAQLSADTLDLKKEYNLVLELSNTINLNNYTENGEVKKEVLEALENEFTIYYTNKEIKALDAIDDVVKAMNKLNRHDMQSIQFNTIADSFVYRETFANSQKQFANRR